MEEGRKSMLRDTIRSLHRIADRLCLAVPRCSYECDAILYGMLIKQMHDIGLPRPGEAIPDQGFAMESLVKNIRQFKDPTWFSQRDVAHEFEAKPEPPKLSAFGPSPFTYTPPASSSFGSGGFASQPAKPVKCYGIGKGHKCTLQGLLSSFQTLLSRTTGLNLP